MAVGALQHLPEGRPSYKNIIVGSPIINIKAASKHKGEPALIYTDPEVSLLSDRLQLALIGKFAGERPSMEFLCKGFKTIGFKGEYQLGLVDEQHILIRFELADDYHRCWLHSTWNFRSYEMRVLKWTPTFHVDEEPAVAPVWVTLERLPLFMFSKDPMFSIGNLIGKPLKIDSATENLTRPSVARICVEIDLLKPLLRRFWIEHGETGYWQSIKYEAIPTYCTSCKRFGHSNGDCNPEPSSRAKPKEVWKLRMPINNKETPTPTTNPAPLLEESNQQVQQRSSIEVNVVATDMAVDYVLGNNVSVIENDMGTKDLTNIMETTTKITCPEAVCKIAKERPQEQGTKNENKNKNGSSSIIEDDTEEREADSNKILEQCDVDGLEQCSPVAEEPTISASQLMGPNQEQSGSAVHCDVEAVVEAIKVINSDQQASFTPPKQPQLETQRQQTSEPHNAAEPSHSEGNLATQKFFKLNPFADAYQRPPNY